MKQLKLWLLAFILIFGIVACTQSADVEEQVDEATTSEEETAAEEPVAEEPAEDMEAVAEGTVVVDDVERQPAPAFDSSCHPADEGQVQPVDLMPDRPLRIAVLGLENNPFWIPVKEGTLAAAAELEPYNTTVEWLVPGETHLADDFSGAIEASVAQEYDAIATVAGDAGLAPFINSAVEAGIPVATFNSETDAENQRLFFVGADLYQQGQTACQAMADAIGGEGKVGIITGFFAVEAHELRRMGFVDCMEENYPDVEIVGEVENQDQAETAFTQAQDFMTANPDLAGIYVTAGGPFGAARAVEDAGMTGEVAVVSFDFVDETMQYVQSGVIYATIGQNPYAQGHDPAVRLFNYLLTGEPPECGRLVTEAAIVTQDNIGDFWSPEAGLIEDEEAPQEDEGEAVTEAEIPPFDSSCHPADEGTVTPVDQMPEQPLRIAVLGLENNPFWIPVKEGTLTAAAELEPYDTTVEWLVPGETHLADDFAGAIEASIAQEYDAIATIAGDAGVAPFIDQAVEAGIPVATFNSETDAVNKRMFFVGADLYQQGETACQAMADAIGGEGQVGIITGFFAVEAHELRRMGFVDCMEENYPDVEIVGEVENQDQGDTAFTQAQDFMTANPDLAGIYVTAGGPFGAARAVEDAGKTGEVAVVSFDFVDETMEYVQKGVISATIGQNPYAQGHDPAIRLFNYLVAGVVPECGRLITEAAVVTQDNIDDYWSPPN